MGQLHGGGPKAGHGMKLYRNGGTVAVPVWREFDEVGDVGMPEFPLGLAELKRRASDWTKNLATLFGSISFDFRFLHGLDKVGWELLVDDMIGKRAREWAMCDGDITTVGTYGFRMPALLAEFPWDQPLEDVSGHDNKLAIAFMIDENDNEVDPSFIEIGGTAGSS